MSSDHLSLHTSCSRRLNHPKKTRFSLKSWAFHQLPPYFFSSTTGSTTLQPLHERVNLPPLWFAITPVIISFNRKWVPPCLSKHIYIYVYIYIYMYFPYILYWLYIGVMSHESCSVWKWVNAKSERPCFLLEEAISQDNDGPLRSPVYSLFLSCRILMDVKNHTIPPNWRNWHEIRWDLPVYPHRKLCKNKSPHLFRVRKPPKKWCQEDAWAPKFMFACCMVPGCNVAFGLFKRRHHCRRCGRLVCSTCAPHSAVDFEMLGMGVNSEACYTFPNAQCMAYLLPTFG